MNSLANVTHLLSYELLNERLLRVCSSMQACMRLFVLPSNVAVLYDLLKIKV